MAIVHEIPPERWPTAAEAARARLFQPIRLGPCEAVDRTWVPAMVPWRATADGLVTPDVLDWYGRFADGRPGVLVVEATGIRDVPSGPLLRIGHDRFLDGLARLVDVVRQRSGGQTRLFIQIIDFLAIKRRPDPARFFREFLAIGPEHRERLTALRGNSRIASLDDGELREALAGLPPEELDAVLSPRELESLRMGYRERVTDTHLPHVRDLPRVLPDLFAATAARAARAGFDGVELHFAHAYTMASFLSAMNTRDDGYGGPRENRVRLPIEVSRATRAAIPAATALGCRFLSDEAIAGGSGVDDAAFFGVELARAGLDYLSLSVGGKFEDAKQPRIGDAAYPYTGPSGHECMPTVRSDARGPFGRNLPLARTVRAAVRAAGFEAPIVASGGITSFTLAERALADGDCDIVGAARQSLADPDWWLKMRLGRGDEIRRCSLTNYCEGLDQKHKKVTCQLWDRIPIPGEPADVPREGIRRLVAPAWKR